MRHVVAIIALLLVPEAARASVAQADRCYAWSDAAPIVHREKLMSARDMQEQTRKRLEGDLLRITLCVENGEFVYRLVVQAGGGRLKHVTVNAKAPF